MKEKIAQIADMVTSLTKGKEITDDPDLQRNPTSWKDGIHPLSQIWTTFVNKED